MIVGIALGAALLGSSCGQYVGEQEILDAHSVIVGIPQQQNDGALVIEVVSTLKPGASNSAIGDQFTIPGTLRQSIGWSEITAATAHLSDDYLESDQYYGGLVEVGWAEQCVHEADLVKGVTYLFIMDRQFRRRSIEPIVGVSDNWLLYVQTVIEEHQ